MSQPAISGRSHEAGRIADAEAHYRAALAARSLEAYERAIANDRAFRDAHYNLACLYERIGKGPAALRHLRIYRELAKGTPQPV